MKSRKIQVLIINPNFYRKHHVVFYFTSLFYKTKVEKLSLGVFIT